MGYPNHLALGSEVIIGCRNLLEGMSSDREEILLAGETE
jgi:hypothetical protein